MSNDCKQITDVIHQQHPHHFPNNNNRIVLSKSDGALNGNRYNELPSLLNLNILKLPNKVTSDDLQQQQQHYLNTSQSTYSLPDDDDNHFSQTSSITNLTDSFTSLYLPNFAQQISTTIMSGLNWINQINATTLFQNFWTSGFLRRRVSQTPRENNDGNYQPTSNDSSITYSQYKFARILNGTIKLQTLKPSELIELSSFGLVELDNDIEPGIGHEFQRYENEKATWCDSCGEFLFPSVMNDNHFNNDLKNHHINHPNQIQDTKRNNSRTLPKAPASVQADHLLRTYFQCSKCKYVCHWKCLNLIRIDCQSIATNPVTSTTINDSSTTTIKTSQISETSSNELLQTTETDSNNNHHKDHKENDHNNHSSSFDSTNDVSSNIRSDNSTFSSEDDQTANGSSEKVFSDSNIHENDKYKENSTNESHKETTEVKSSTESYLITPRIILDLRAKILKHNERVRSRGSGLGITLIDEQKGLFRGFLRVHMNLTRPINVIAGKRPPSIYDIINEEENNANNQRRTLTSFYMPRDTVKNIHITSDSTSLQVIKAMLKKFKVVDNPQKFALYLRRRFPEEELTKTADGEVLIDENSSTRISDDNQNELTISKFLKTAGHEHSLKRLHDHERPLILQLEFDSFAYGSVDIVLQENDNADIAWDAFEVPELKNFLKILEREEGEHLEHVKAHYHEMRRILQALIDYEESKLLSNNSGNRSHPGNSILTVSG